MTDSYLTRARLAKADALADLLERHGARASDLEDLPTLGWSMAAELAGVRPPSTATQALVMFILSDRAKHQSALVGAL